MLFAKESHEMAELEVQIPDSANFCLQQKAMTPRLHSLLKAERQETAVEYHQRAE